MLVSKEEMQQIADAAAEKTLNRVFLALGMDISDSQSVLRHQKDMAYVRAWRESMETVKGITLKTAVTVVLTGFIGFFAMWWKGHGGVP